MPRLLVVLAMAGLAARPAAAQGPRAGLVVQFGPGDVRSYCVDLGAGERSGADLLRLAGLDVVAEERGGTMVCRLDGVGCAFPAEPCWCQCQNLAAGCTYWSYNVLRDGQWQYSTVGAHARVLRDGDVDGWAWGAGTVTRGARPPDTTFNQVCPANAATVPATLAQPASRTPAPSVTSPPAATSRRPTAPRQGPTALPTRSAQVTAPARPTATRAGLATAALAAPPGGPYPGPSTGYPGPASDAERAALAATSTAIVATLTALAPATATAGGPTATPDEAAARVAHLNSATPLGTMSGTDAPPAPAGAGTPPPHPPADLGEATGAPGPGAGWAGYAVLALVLGGLAVAWWRLRRSRRDGAG